ncbi:MAG: radical SAM protein [Bacteroidetes bacterium]|nr:radical SAM protein [Bacteroidota bacterium]
MLDNYNRKLNYLRISVTDRCNLRCTYCMPEEGVTLLSHTDILSFEEIKDVVNEAVLLGIDKIRITGGEPLVRKGIVALIEMLSSNKGIKDLSMTTNGILLSQYADVLKEKGLHRINISLDTLDAEKFRTITRGGDIEKVKEGILAAKNAGLNPIKINCVIKESKEEADAKAVKEFCIKNELEVRYIHQMNLKTGHFAIVEGGDGGNCENCNRLRLTANGKIKPCLFNNLEFDIREMGIKEALLAATSQKPKCGSFNAINHFNNIGG